MVDVTFLGDLIRDATADTVPVHELLRRLKVIAARSGTAELAEWVGHELTGYPSADVIPAYRGPFEIPVLGHLSGPFGSEIRNFPLAPVVFPKDFRDSHLFRVAFTDSVAELDHHLKTGQLALEAPWPADMLAYVEYFRAQGKVSFADGRYTLVGAKRVIPINLVVSSLDAVRDRILDLALSFEEVAPGAGESPATPEESARMSQVFQTNVYGGQVAVGSANVHQVQVNRGDEGALFAALSAAGVAPDSLEDLKKALAEDRAENGGEHTAEPGSSVSRWWSRLRLKGAAAAGAIGTGATGDLIAQSLGGFFGMG